MPKPRVAISACLLGDTVRYDGRDAREPAVEELAPHVTWLPVCPEMELGLGCPREPIRIEREGKALRLRQVAGRRDLTQAMAVWVRTWLAANAPTSLRGLVVKSRSPSCGWGTAPVHDGEDVVGHDDGRFTAAVCARRTGLPVIDELGVRDEARRARFLQAVRLEGETTT